MLRCDFRRKVLTGRQIKAARAMVDMSQDTLAERTKLSVQTIRRLEASEDQPVVAMSTTLDNIRAVLDKAGVVFLEAPAGVRLKK